MLEGLKRNFGIRTMTGVGLAALVVAVAACGGSGTGNTSEISGASGSEPASRPAATSAVGIIESSVEAHGGQAAWLGLGTPTFKLSMQKLDENGSPKGDPNEMTLTFPTDGRAEIEGRMGGMVMKYKDGKTEVMTADGKKIEDKAAHQRAWFSLPTFQYILSLPWKLTDPGSIHELCKRCRS